MGLDIRPRQPGSDKFISDHWVSRSYKGFRCFRRRLAAEEGIDLDVMAGFGTGLGQVSWDGVTSPLIPLLNHSDCDGHLTPAQCAQMMPRLAEICERWSADRKPWLAAVDHRGRVVAGQGDLFREVPYLERLIALLGYCAENGLIADFY